METLLRVDEWKSPTGIWYVADVHTFAGWRDFAAILGIADLDNFINYLKKKYKAEIDDYFIHNDYLMFHWKRDDYKYAHQFKLDINRIARKKNYLIERSF